MRMITLHICEGRLKILDELVRRGVYPNRAEAIRAAINDLLDSETEYEIE